MKKNKFRKLLLMMACAATTLAAGAVVASCDTPKSDVSFVEEEKKEGPQFLEGALHTIYVNDRVILAEYVEYVDEDYTITITDEKGNVEDVTNKRLWYTRTSGTYTITYTVKGGKYKGVSTFELSVIFPELTWEYSLQNLPYKFGETLDFETYFDAMNIYTSLKDTVVKMDSVEVDGETIDLSEADSYTFTSRSDHTFQFSATSPDGQTCEGREVISIKVIEEDYMQELEEMDISLYGELYVERGSFTLVEGSYCNGNNVIFERKNGPQNVPYLAYNGDYGIGDFVKIDFTGNNMPIFSFFRDSYSQNIHDSTKGFVFTGGFKNNTGAPLHNVLCSRTTLYGPYMMHKYDQDFEDTRTVGSKALEENGQALPYPGSMNSLEDGTRYRMIVGFSGVRQGKANLLGTETAVDTLFLELSCVIINLDTKEIFSKFTIDSYGLQALGYDEIPLDTENNSFLNGNIVLYGNHGERTVWDQIYPIIEDTTFEAICEEELIFSSFKADAPNFFLDAEAELNVSDFVDTNAEGYKFFYRDEAGNTYNVDGDTFLFGESGSYTLYYTDGTNLCATLNVFVANFSEEVLQWVQEKNLSFYGLDTLSDEKAITLKESTIAVGGNYSGPNAGDYINQSYMALNGEYGLNDYVAFDFTGKNMPEVAFFAKNFNKSMYYQNGGKQGIVFANGITDFQGGLDTGVLGNGTQVNIDSPFMMQSIDTWFVKERPAAPKIARANLVDGTHYRVILGFTDGSSHGAGGITLHWYLYDLDANVVVEQSKIETWNFFTGSNAQVNNMTLDDLVGSIVLYGKFGTTLTIDKLYGVYEDASLETVVAEFNKTNKYTVEFRDAEGNLLQSSVLQYGEIPVYNGEIPSLDKEDEWYVYSYGWDKEITAVTGHTVYTLTEIGKPKGNKDFKNVTINGEQIVLGASSIGDNANYTKGQQNGGYVRQSYFALNENYGLNNYIVFDFTGKNLPEIAFFAKNYNDSMYADGTAKQGIVVVTGITTWDGQDNAALTTEKAAGTYVNYGFPYMIQDAANGGFTQGAFAESALGRANLVDGTHYRVIMGFTKSGEQAITLNWCLYNLDTKEVVEESSMTTWNFFTGSNAQVGNMAIDDLSGSIVLYGKFGTTCTIDKLHGVVNGDFETVAANAKAL